MFAFHFGFPLHHILDSFNCLFIWGICETLLWFCESELYPKIYSEKCHCLFINATLFPFPPSFYPFPTRSLYVTNLFSFQFILPAFFIFCTNGKKHMYFLISLFFLTWRTAHYIYVFELCVFHMTIFPGNHFISVFRALSFVASQYSTMCVYRNLINHSVMYEHFDFSHCLAITNNTAMNKLVHMYCYIVVAVSSR